MTGHESAQPNDLQVEIWLHQALYRFDCPSPLAVGEYHFQLLPAEQSLGIAQHVLDCEDCHAELEELRSCVRQSIAAPESALARARRLVASLLPPVRGLASAGLRGRDEPTVRVYEVDDVTLTIGAGKTAHDVIGLVMVTSRPPEELVGRAVRLVPVEGPVQTATLDDIGNFEFAGVLDGTYVLEVELPDAVVTVEALQLG